MNIRTKAYVGMVLLTVTAFILGGVVTYNFLPAADTFNAGSSPGPPPWSPRVGPSPEGQGPPDGSQPSPEEARKERERRQRFVERWKQKLDLTDEQVEQFHEIFTAGHEKFIAVEQASRDEFARIRRETDEAISRVLNPEQASRYTEIIEEFRNRRRNQKESKQEPGERKD